MIEQRLANHSDVVARLFQDQHCATIQEEIQEQAGTRDNPSDESASGARASKEGTLCERDPPPTCTVIYDPSRGQTTQPNIDELPEDGPAGGAVAGNSMQHESLQPMSAASQGSRLHLSDFIQNVSE